MEKGDYLSTILRSEKTVFTARDISLLWQESDTDIAKTRINYYTRNGDLYRIRRGIYAKTKNYNKLELATRIITPSYVSFETVLTKEGVIFQFHNEITVASYLTRTIQIDGQIYSYKRLKDSVLFNTTGINHEEETSIASKERAFLDTLYINTDYHFDNIRSLDWEIIRNLSATYENKRMLNKLTQLQVQTQKS